MQKMVEFFEMVSLNDAALGGREKLSILKARLALRMFERAVSNLKADLAENGVVPCNASVQVVAAGRAQG